MFNILKFRLLHSRTLASCFAALLLCLLAYIAYGKIFTRRTIYRSGTMKQEGRVHTKNNYQSLTTEGTRFQFWTDGLTTQLGVPVDFFVHVNADSSTNDVTLRKTLLSHIEVKELYSNTIVRSIECESIIRAKMNNGWLYQFQNPMKSNITLADNDIILSGKYYINMQIHKICSDRVEFHNINIMIVDSIHH